MIDSLINDPDPLLYRRMIEAKNEQITDIQTRRTRHEKK